MPLSLPIGIDDFRKVREQGLAYIDKSHLIRELLDAPGVEVVLLPRPRRFGKTLNLSMLRYWFEKRDEDLSHLFRDLSIWQAGEAYRAGFQRHPVIHLTLKGVKAPTFEGCWSKIREKIVDLFDEHRYLLDCGRLDDVGERRFRQILSGAADPELYERALFDLSAYLHAHHGERVVVLLDEYDEPIHAGYLNGYGPRILDFMRGFFTDGLKGNEHLYRGVVTGILRVSRENLFSGANNWGVYTLLARQYNTCFGFTEAEVLSLLDRAGRREALDAVRSWYNGYLFGGEVIYNPWSVLNYLQRDEATPQAYWLSTSSNDLVRELLERYALRLEPVFEALLQGGSALRVLDESVALSELAAHERAMWSLLVFTGYLKPERAGVDALERVVYRLSIPNREVREVYATTFQRWMDARLQGHGADLAKLTRALFDGDAEGLAGQLQAFVMNLLSYQDPGAVDPERVYQGFVLGLLAVLEPEYLVRSNRESGEGRSDVTIRHRMPGRPAVMLELKVARKGKKTPAAAFREGLSQIRAKRYEAELVAAGAPAVHAFVVVFDGKQVWVKSAGATKDEPRPVKRPVARRRRSKR